MKKSNKKYVLLLFILIIFFIVMFFMYGINKKKTVGSFVVNKNEMFSFSEGTWKVIRTADDLKKFNWEKFNVYADNELLGKKMLWYDDNDGWYLFDSNRNSYNYAGNLFAYNTTYDFQYLNIVSSDIDTLSYAKTLMKKNNVNVNTSYTNANLYEVDFDNDGVQEKFYTITNAFDIDNNPSKYFSFVFMVKNEKIYVLYNAVAKFSTYDGCIPYINAIGDFDNDKNREILIGCNKYSIQTPITMLYKYDKREFKLILSN